MEAQKNKKECNITTSISTSIDKEVIKSQMILIKIHDQEQIYRQEQNGLLFETENMSALVSNSFRREEETRFFLRFKAVNKVEPICK